jgi:hypothetical protein
MLCRSLLANGRLLKVEASGGKEAPASLLVSLNGVGDSAGSVADFVETRFSSRRRFSSILESSMMAHAFAVSNPVDPVIM